MHNDSDLKWNQCVKLVLLFVDVHQDHSWQFHQCDNQTSKSSSAEMVCHYMTNCFRNCTRERALITVKRNERKEISECKRGQHMHLHVIKNSISNVNFWHNWCFILGVSNKQQEYTLKLRRFICKHTCNSNIC